MRADLALIGFGRVGRRLAMLLRERRDWLLREYDLECRIVGIATRRHGVTFSIGGVDVDAASRRSLAGLRVETTTLSIEDGQPAIAHIDAAFDAGCHAVTANKGPVAFAYRRLADRAAAAGLLFLFEGVVMDGVPVFNLVRETMPAVHVHGFRGVINSTTNYILSALEDGQPFGTALAAMQEAGIAEADPELDLEGWDAAAKTAALANVLMGADLNPHTVDRIGIGPGSAEPASAARLVATGFDSSRRRQERPQVPCRLVSRRWNCPVTIFWLVLETPRMPWCCTPMCWVTSRSTSSEAG